MNSTFNFHRHKGLALLAFSFLLVYSILGGILGFISSQILVLSLPLVFVSVILGAACGLVLGLILNSFFVKSYII